jgi:hypothetical protein
MLFPSRRYQPVRAKLFMAFVEDRVRHLKGFHAAGPA